MRLLTVANPKTRKGEADGYLTGILMLSPAATVARRSLCTSSTVGCRGPCLAWQGRAGMWSKASGEYLDSAVIIHAARARRTMRYETDRAGFLGDLRRDLIALCRAAHRHGRTPAVRLNGMSDLPSLALQMADEHPNVQFYDYTKHPKPWLRLRPNYHLTFSRSESNGAACVDAYRHGINVAVVFDVRKSAALPHAWRGMPVIDGDVSDLRFLDPAPCIVGLRAKGTARHDTTGFVLRP